MYCNGSMGDIDSTSINQLKDVIFQGNEDAYYMAENIFAFAASTFIPISQASIAGNLTFRSGTTIAAKEGISMATGELASAATLNVTGNQTASMLAGMMASGATVQGLNGIDGKFNISGWNKSGTITLNHKSTSGVELTNKPGKTTTILGRYGSDTGDIIKELDLPKSMDFGMSIINLSLMRLSAVEMRY